MDNQTLLQQLSQKILLWGPKLLAFLILITFFFFLKKIIKRIVLRTLKKKLHEYLAKLITDLISYSIMIFGFATALGTLGVDITAIVASLGLASFAVGYALKDLISNVLSGILIIFYKTFEVGNYINISGQEGKVQNINLRHTELDNGVDRILIPNSKVFTTPISIKKQG